MANTGKKIVLTLKQVDQATGAPSGMTKPNAQDDPDYIAPYKDTKDCPIVADTTCPVLLTTGKTASIELELNVTNGVLSNSNIRKIKVKIMDGGGTVEQVSKVYNLPFSPSTNYKYDLVAEIPVGVHKMQIDYLNGADSIVANCSDYPTVQTA